MSDELDRVLRIAAQCRKHRVTTEAERRLAPAVTEELASSGLCRGLLPPEEHGLGLSPLEILDYFALLAGAEASAAWIVWNNVLFCELARSLDATVRKDVFREPSWLFAQSTRPGGRAHAEGDGFRVAGRWELVSGCELAEWLLLLCEFDEGAPRFALLHREEVAIRDTWDVGGLRGTGSHDVEVDCAMISAGRVVSLADRSKAGGPWAHFPIISVTSAGLGAQSLGVAHTLLAALVERGRADTALVVGRHSAAIEAAQKHLRDCVERLWRRACEKSGATAQEIGAAYAATDHAIQSARCAVEAIYDAAGTRALYVTEPFERAHRDLRAMLQHIVAQSIWVEDAGRVQMGFEPEQALFAL